MKDLTKYPKALQLLMQTDGTVTELIKLLSGEDIKVIKLSEQIDEKSRLLYRHIFLQGVDSGKNWLYAKSKIHLDNLPVKFVDDLLRKTIPIGTLWINYRMETFKKLTNQSEETSEQASDFGFKFGTKLLTRAYHVYNNQKLIMEIKEKFPIIEYENLIKS